MLDLADDLTGSRANFGRFTFDGGPHGRQSLLAELNQPTVSATADVVAVVVEVADQLLGIDAAGFLSENRRAVWDRAICCQRGSRQTDHQKPQTTMTRSATHARYYPVDIVGEQMSDQCKL